MKDEGRAADLLLLAPTWIQTVTDSSILGLLQLQHPLSSGQVIHFLKSFNLGGNTEMLIKLPALMVNSRYCTSTWHDSYERDCHMKHFSVNLMKGRWLITVRMNDEWVRMEKGGQDTFSYLVTHSLFHIRSNDSKGWRRWNKNDLLA